MACARTRLCYEPKEVEYAPRRYRGEREWRDCACEFMVALLPPRVGDDASKAPAGARRRHVPYCASAAAQGMAVPRKYASAGALRERA